MYFTKTEKVIAQFSKIQTFLPDNCTTLSNGCFEQNFF